MVNRHNMSLKQLNAMLRLRNYHKTYGSLPPYDELKAYIDTIDSFYIQLYSSLRDGRETQLGVRDQAFRDRFNLDAVETPHIVADSDDEDAARTDVKSIDVAWGNYVRFLFAAHNVYSFVSLAPPIYFWVAENKSVAYRDASKEGESIGRALSIIWLVESHDQTCEEDLNVGERVFEPASGQSLEVANLSLAEISLVSGYYPPGVTPHHSDRDVELMHERKFLDLCAERFESRRAGVNDGSLWRFVVDVSSGVDLEHWNYATRDMGDHTKMSLARQLQVRDSLSDEGRNKVYGQKKAVLLAALHGPGAVAALAAAPAPAGKGRAAAPAGRGKGKGGKGGKGSKGGKGPARGGRRGRGKG